MIDSLKKPNFPSQVSLNIKVCFGTIFCGIFLITQYFNFQHAMAIQFAMFLTLNKAIYYFFPLTIFIFHMPSH